MKLLSLTVLMLAFVCSAALGQISGTGHDFTSTGSGAWKTATEKCAPCHTPHTGDMTNGAPLWDHDLTTASYTMYSYTSTSGLQGTVGSAPGGNSKLCMSCHDGTVALDSFGGATGSTTLGTGDAGFLDTDLSDDHPVSITYTTATATADGELFNPATALSGLGGTIAADMLVSGSVECSSCHDVHDNTNAPFLVKSNAGSALCLTCHDK